MPGRLPASFRVGNLAENLGVLLLRGLAAVVEVPRTEDVGIDAVATLLRYDTDRNFYAEETFVVQIKTLSQPTIEYTGPGLVWCVGQTEPMFIGRVDSDAAKIALYSTMPIIHAKRALHVNRVVAQFGPGPFGGAVQWSGSDSNSPPDADRHADAWLGGPVIEWSLADIGLPEWRDQTYRFMKAFLRAVRRQLELHELGWVHRLTWRANDPTSIKLEFVYGGSPPEGLAVIAPKLLPALESLSYCFPPPEVKPSLLNAIIKLLDELMGLGVDAQHSLQIAKLADSARQSFQRQATEEP